MEQQIPGFILQPCDLAGSPFSLCAVALQKEISLC